MDDLNDFYFFARVVEHGGFAAAGRALNLPKSRLSRRIAGLEERLGVRLIQRSTRRFAVTAVGQSFYAHCQAMIADAEAAREVVEHSRAEPQGIVRVACPWALAQTRLAPIVSGFLARYPRVRIHVEATNRRVDVIEEGFDVALRVRPPPLEDTDLVLKVLATDESSLVASTGLLDRLGRPAAPEDLARLDSLDMTRADGRHRWRLTGPDGAVRTVAHSPRLATDEMTTLRRAALDGVGVVQLPAFMVEGDLAAGRLERVLPGWTPAGGLVHAVFPSRRGLVPAVRDFIDILAADFARHPPSPPGNGD